MSGYNGRGGAFIKDFPLKARGVYKGFPLKRLRGNPGPCFSRCFENKARKSNIMGARGVYKDFPLKARG